MINNEQLNSIKKNIDNEGFHCIENYVAEEELSILRQFYHFFLAILPLSKKYFLYFLMQIL